MKVTFVQWAGNFPDSEKVKSKKIKDGKEDWIVNPLPSWFSTGEAIEIPDEQFWSRIDELLSLNFYLRNENFLILVQRHSYCDIR